MRQLIRHAASVLVLVVLVAPPAAMAQQAGKVYRIGYLSPRPGIELPEEAFRQGLRELGYAEGQNLVIDWRFTKGTIAMSPSLAAEIVRLNPDCIVTIGVGPTTRVDRQPRAARRKHHRHHQPRRRVGRETAPARQGDASSGVARGHSV